MSVEDFKRANVNGREGNRRRRELKGCWPLLDFISILGITNDRREGDCPLNWV